MLFFRQNYTQKLFIAFKKDYSCGFSLMGNLDLRDFHQKKFYNIKYTGYYDLNQQPAIIRHSKFPPNCLSSTLFIPQTSSSRRGGPNTRRPSTRWRLEFSATGLGCVSASASLSSRSSLPSSNCFKIFESNGPIRMSRHSNLGSARSTRRTRSSSSDSSTCDRRDQS